MIQYNFLIIFITFWATLYLHTVVHTLD